MSSNSRANMSSKYSSLKEFYENFKDELDEDDFVVDKYEAENYEVEEVYVLEEFEEHLESENIPPVFLKYEEVEDAEDCFKIDESLYVLDSDEERNGRKRKNQPKTKVPTKRLKVCNEHNKNRSPDKKFMMKSVSETSKSVLKITKSTSMKKSSAKTYSDASQTISNDRVIKVKKLPPQFQFVCDVCGKGSNKKTFMKQHTADQCERSQNLSLRHSTKLQKTTSC